MSPGWFADPDDEEGTGEYVWRPYLQADGVCAGLPIWFSTREAAEEFIRDNVLGKGMI